MLRKFIKKVIDSWIELECKFVKQEKHSKKRVLILRKDVLGDFIIFMPTLKFYREYYREYEISLVVSSMSLSLGPVFPFIDNVIPFNQRKFRTNFFYRRSFIKNLTRKGFDISIYPVWSREPIGDLMVKVTKAAEKITFKTTYDYSDSLYTKIINIPSDLNEFDRNLAFVSKIAGKDYTVTFPTMDISLLDNKKANILKEGYKLVKNKYCILFPGAGAPYRIWQLNKFAEVCDYVNKLGFTPVLCGSLSENKLGDEIIKLVKNKNIINFCGKTESDIPTLAHIINDSAFYFGSETGVLHLACALDIPTVVILGGGHFGRFFPYGDLEKNRIVFDPNMKCKMDDWKCSQNLKEGEIAPCIKNITVETAKKEIDSVLKYIK